MASLARNPLGARPNPHQPAVLPPFYSTLKRTTPATSAKRARSPELAGAAHLQSAKRHKATTQVTTAAARDEARKEKDRKRQEREDEFKSKYSRAFPSFVFYFDMDTFSADIKTMRHMLEKRVTQMGGHVEEFFSREITHLISFQTEESNKENTAENVNPTPVLGSPIKLRGRAVKDAPSAAPSNLAQKALALNIKVWSPSKLENVLDRCQGTASAVSTVVSASQSGAAAKETLRARLEEERIRGTTERDPTQRRHDFIYFSKNSCFLLVEDMRQELAPIAACEFPYAKARDGTLRGSWPVLHCDPRARGPFIPFDEREERRREKADRAERQREHERARRKARLVQQERIRKTQEQMRRTQAEQQQHDLRRCASMNNLQHRAPFPDFGLEGLIDLDADETTESVNASGFLASGAYIAASGNSVGITSTTGTTSTAGLSLSMHDLPPALKGRLLQQVMTSRRVSTGMLGVGKEEKMGPPPPPAVAGKPNVLRKSRSTNTLKLPKREEGTKPGYCESCRVKFKKFQEHIDTRRHRKFALDDGNFIQLDYLLGRVKRRTVQEVEEEEQLWESRLKLRDSQETIDLDEDDDDDTEETLPTQETIVGDMQWDEWEDDDDEV